MNDADRKATQEFSVRNALVTYCGQSLTPNLIDRITAELVQEMQAGPTAWAFGVMASGELSGLPAEIDRAAGVKACDEAQRLIAEYEALTLDTRAGSWCDRVLSLLRRTTGVTASDDLDPRTALAYAKRMKEYCESFNGRDWGSVMLHGSTDEQNLAHALDNLTECAAMLMNMAGRIAASGVQEGQS